MFNEPLSFIQRLAEYMENAYLLDKAAKCEDPYERLEVFRFKQHNITNY